jgi:hypothetical protein
MSFSWTPSTQKQRNWWSTHSSSIGRAWRPSTWHHFRRKFAHFSYSWPEKEEQNWHRNKCGCDDPQERSCAQHAKIAVHVVRCTPSASWTPNSKLIRETYRTSEMLHQRAREGSNCPRGPSWHTLCKHLQCN